KSAGVGSQFEFVQKHESYEQIAEAHDLTMEDVQPADYEAEITYLPPEDLIEIGVGKPHVGVGTGKPGGTGNLKNQL
ncbi:MAG: hypothetical protein LC676_19725, partial [Loktanella sp.]|nr:hypothetical protein [Loktanella sp.]